VFNRLPARRVIVARWRCGGKGGGKPPHSKALRAVVRDAV